MRQFVLRCGGKIYKGFRAKSSFSRVIAFHSIDDNAFPPDKLYYLIHSILNDGIQIVSLSELVSNRISPPEGIRIAFTFDDGYQNNVTKGLPILEELGINATIFVATAHIGRETGDHGLATALLYNYDMVTWDDLGLWQEKGMSVGFHTHKHLNLGQTSLSIAAEDLAIGIETLSESIDWKGPKFFAYPLGIVPGYFEDYASLLKNYGFLAAFTAEWRDLGRTSNLFLTPRVAIGDTDSIDLAKAKIYGCLDWVFWLKHRRELQKKGDKYGRFLSDKHRF